MTANDQVDRRSVLDRLITEGEAFTYENFSTKSSHGYTQVPTVKWNVWCGEAEHWVLRICGTSTAPAGMLEQAHKVQLIGNGADKFNRARSLYLGALECAGRVMPEQAEIRRVDTTATISQYRYVKELGAGGYGNVWLAFDEQLQRNVAIKVIRPSMNTHDKFALEQARALVRAAHPNVVTVFAVAQLPDPKDSGQTVTGIVMEYVQGEALACVLEKVLSAEAALNIGLALVSAIGWMHKQGLEHGDLHSDNVLIQADGTIKVIDLLYVDSLKLLGTMKRNERQESDLRIIRFMLGQILDCARVGPEVQKAFGIVCHGNLTVDALRSAFASALSGPASPAVGAQDERNGEVEAREFEKNAMILMEHLYRAGNKMTVRKPPNMPPIVRIDNENYYQTGNPAFAQKFADAVDWLVSKGLLRLEDTSAGLQIFDALNIPPSPADWYTISEAGYRWMREKGRIK